MNNSAIGTKKLRSIKRKAVSVSNQQLTNESFFENQPIPLIIQANKIKLNLVSWAVRFAETASASMVVINLLRASS